FTFDSSTNAAPPPVSTLSLHDALPIFGPVDEVVHALGVDADAASLGLEHAVRGELRDARAHLGQAQAQRGVTPAGEGLDAPAPGDRKSTRLNSSHDQISYAVFCLKKKK